MTNQEIRGAIAWTTPIDEDFIITTESLKAIIRLRTLAQQVLDAKMPKLAIRDDKPLQEDANDTQIYGKMAHNNMVDGYNQAFHDFRLWQVKCLMELEEVIDKVVWDKRNDTPCSCKDRCCQAIRNLFGGGK